MNKRSKRERVEYDPPTEEQVQEFILMIAQRVKTLRKKKGYTSSETFSFDHFFPRSQYGEYEKKKDFQMSTFFKLCHALDVSPIEFFKTGIDWNMLLKMNEAEKVRKPVEGKK